MRGRSNKDIQFNVNHLLNGIMTKMPVCQEVSCDIVTGMRHNRLPFSRADIRKRVILKHAPEIHLGRIACVGREIVNMKNCGSDYPPLSNMAKGRVDLVLDIVNGKRGRPIAKEVVPFVSRKDLIPMIYDQQYLDWTNHNNDRIHLLVMDSFSDLTDQKFTHRLDGWSFCSHYSGLLHTDRFKEQFTCEGLLDIQIIPDVYERFFQMITKKYPTISIVFIHYSSKFDSRPEFKKRENVIKEAILGLQNEDHRIMSLSLHESDFFANEYDDFPYHYSRETYKRFVKAWENNPDPDEPTNKG